MHFVSWFIALFFVMLMPLLHFKTTIDPVLYPRFLAMAIGVILLTMMIYVASKKKGFDPGIMKSNFFKIFSAFVLITVISLIFATNPVEGLTDLLKWTLAGLLIAFVSLVIINDDSSIEILTKAAVINSLIACFIGIYQYFNLPTPTDESDAFYKVKGLMAHKNQYAISLFLLLPFLTTGVAVLRKTWKKLAITGLVATLLMLLLLQTRSVWIGLFVCAVFSAILLALVYRNHPVLKKQKKLIKRFSLIAVTVFLAGIAVLFVLPQESPASKIRERVLSVFDLQQTSNYWRLEMWEATVRIIGDHPVIGVGPGNWILHIYPYYGKYLPSVFRQWRHPHNDYLGAASEKGIGGLLLYLAILFFLVLAALRTLKRQQKTGEWWTGFWMLNGLAGFMAISFFSFPAQRINQVVFFCLIASVILAKYELSGEKEETHEKVNLKWLVVLSMVVSGFSVYFGLISNLSEYYVAKVHTARELQQWNRLKQEINKGYYELAPIEPKYSVPTIMYKGIAAYHADRDYRKALEYFKKARKKHPTNVSISNNIGSTYGQMGMYDSSLVWYNKSLNIFPHYEHPLLNMAKAYYLKNDYEKAYQYVLRCDPESETADVHALRRKLEEELGR